ncbi:forkhead-associated (FHA) domain-containing protein [Wolffia australiana]
MGATAPVARWTPDDDVLLKNAVEAGASLESLAKGAVEFSRRFTIRELKERWRHILYDEDMAMEASAYMMTSSVDACLPGSLKSGKICGVRSREWLPGKRKSSRVRSLYYAMRKRIRSSGHYNNPEVDFLEPQAAATDFGGKDGCPEASKSFSEPDGDNPTDPDASARYEAHKFEFSPTHHGDEQDLFRADEVIAAAGALFEFGDVAAVSLDKEVVNGVVHSTGSPQEAHTVEKKPSPSSFGGEPNPNPNLNPEVSDSSSGSLQNLGFPSPLMSMTLWGGIDPGSTLPLGSNFDEDGPRSSPVMNVSGSDPRKTLPEDQLPDEMGMAVLNGSAMIADSDFVSLSLDFAHEDEELFLLNEEGKDIMDGPCLETLNAIFSACPADIHHEPAYPQAPGSKDIEAIMAEGVLHEFSGGRRDPDFREEQVCLAPSNVDEQPSVAPEDSSAEKMKDSSFRGFLEGPMICTLNTEDPDIPCNDDIILPNEVRPSVSKKQEPEASSGNSEVSRFGAGDEIPCQNQLVQMHHAKSAGLKRLNAADFKVKTEPHGMESGEKFVQSSGPSEIGGHLIRPKEEFQGEKLRDDLPSDRAKSDRATDGGGPSQRWASFPGEMGGGGEGDFGGDPCQNYSTSDIDDISSDSDDEVPHFSDVESLILDMDLAFSDHESSRFTREVSRYQFLESKKTLMRLEKSARSNLQRSIASRGALAVLYGRRLRHYIRKPEVSLGRATEDIHVDIDLKREGPANKISRRQAMMKMDEQGGFHLKNTGKFPILISGMELAPGKQVGLNSGSLIEIRGMKFVFEVCPAAISRYVTTNTCRAKEQNPSFSLVAA